MSDVRIKNDAFPEDFLFGGATSDWQFEGGIEDRVLQHLARYWKDGT